MWRTVAKGARGIRSAAKKSVVNFDHSSRVLSSPFEDVHIPDINLGDFVWRDAHKWTNKTAMICGISGRRLTYGEAQGSSQQVSVALKHHLGLMEGDVLALVMPNMPEFPIILLGAAAAGIVTTPANPLYTHEELARQFVIAKIKAVVTVAPLLEKVQAALELVPGCGGPVVLVGGGGPSTGGSVVDFKELMKKGALREEKPSRPDPESVAILPFSSGTTGMPKGVKLTHKNLVANLCQIQHREVVPGPDLEQDRALAILPFFHIYGLNGMMNLSLSLGRKMLILPKFEVKTFSEAFANFKPTVLGLVPPLCCFIAQSPTISAEDLSLVRFVTCGAAATPKSVVQQFLHKANPKIDFKEGYGLTETSCLATSPPSSSSLEMRFGTVGVPIPQTELKIIDTTGEDGAAAALPFGATGEIWVRGPQVMKGYLDDEEATRDALTPDGWLRTGDVGFVDNNGFLKIVDRVKELIKVKGLQVSPTELEAILRTMIGILDVAVVGVPDEVSGELPRAFVVRKEDSEISEEDVMGYLEPHVAQHKQLKAGVRFVKHIPKNAAGKILRNDLKHL